MKSFSFFSSVSLIYSSSIDYFFINRTLLPFVANAEYSTITESDNALVLSDLSLFTNWNALLGNYTETYCLMMPFVN